MSAAAAGVAADAFNLLAFLTKDLGERQWIDGR